MDERIYHTAARSQLMPSTVSLSGDTRCVFNHCVVIIAKLEGKKVVLRGALSCTLVSIALEALSALADEADLHAQHAALEQCRRHLEAAGPEPRGTPGVAPSAKSSELWQRRFVFIHLEMNV